MSHAEEEATGFSIKDLMPVASKVGGYLLPRNALEDRDCVDLDHYPREGERIDLKRHPSGRRTDGLRPRGPSSSIRTSSRR